MNVVLASFAILLFCDSASLFHLGLEGKPYEETHVPVSEAIQKLQEVFDFNELPHKITSAKKPPHFMLELYSRVAAPDGSTIAPGLLEGNVVRSFENKDFSEPGHPFYHFNISSVGTNERMLKAELRVFKWKPSESITKYHFCRVDVFEVLDSSARPWRGNLISSRLLPLHTQGWEVFNVTQTVSRWVGDDSSNHGFIIAFTTPSGKFLEYEPLIFSKQKIDSKKSYLVLFNDDGRRGIPNMYTSPIIKDTDASSPPSEVSSLMNPAAHIFPMEMDNIKSRKTRDVYPSGNPTCERKPLYVDFEEIGWAGWIISPRGYNAYHCKGACLFPMGQGLGATNHATVQSIVHALKLNQDIGTPCCVPDRLNSINLLYFDDEENVVLKQYDGMVAVSCGCH